MNTSFTPAQLEQFRRDAKRFARSSSVPHHAALDQIAVSKGFANWSLMAKTAGSSRVSASTPASPPNPPRPFVPPRGSQRRHLHGDQYESDPARFYCARCDMFLDADHFAYHGPHTGEDYLEALEDWNERDKMYWHDMHRPDDAVNVLEAPALVARAQYQALRPAFSEWLMKQRTRRDDVGMLAIGVTSRRGLPVTPVSLPKLRRHYERRGMQYFEAEALYKAWEEFLESRNSRP